MFCGHNFQFAECGRNAVSSNSGKATSIPIDAGFDRISTESARLDPFPWNRICKLLLVQQCKRRNTMVKARFARMIQIGLVLSALLTFAYSQSNSNQSNKKEGA